MVKQSVAISTMRILTIILVLILTRGLAHGQYPFEEYPAMSYEDFENWKVYDWTETKQSISHTLTIDQFFDNKDSLTIQLTSFISNSPSVIRLFRNKKQTQKMTEQMLFSSLNTGHDPIQVADINGDGLKDLKIVTPYMGNGLAALNVSVIYFFQTKDHEFTKISFSDKMSANRAERDFDGDGNYEIITMNLNGYENHNYWTFNIFEYDGSNLKNANVKSNYPIMIQFLNRQNYEITDKLSRAKMKAFELQLPDEYEKKE